MEEEYQRIISERNNVNAELNDLFHEKSEKDILIKSLTKENLDLQGEVQGLKHEVQELEDLNTKFDTLSDVLNKVEAIKEKYKQDLEICSNYLLEVEEKCQETQKHQLELLSALKEKEEEIEGLQEALRNMSDNQNQIPLQMSDMYRAVKDDPIDQKLSQYMNELPLSLRKNALQLVRESEGVYKYGKKRVFMKIENDLIVIRVGGGYLTFDQFIEQYCNGDPNEKKKYFGLIYGGNCHGSKDFKTFYVT